MEYRRIRITRVGSGKVLRFASKELAAYLKKAEPTLVVDQLEKEKGPKEEGVLTLKVCRKTIALLGVTEPEWEDGYRIEVKNDSGVITGTNERSVLLGVYRFLREIGYAFIHPGMGGERIPNKLPREYEVNVLEKASYRHRGICIEGSNSYENIVETIDFLPKVGMNEYFTQFLVPGTFFDRWYSHRSNAFMEEEPHSREDIIAMTKSFEEEISDRGLIYHKTGHGWTCEPFGIEGTTWDASFHYEIPEETKGYLAELNGKRDLFHNVPLNTNLCYSNPKVREAMTDAMTAYCKENPNVDVLHFWLADGHNNHCECENCRKKRPSDWYVTILNELDEKLTAQNIKTRIVFLIYVDLLWKPEEVLLKNPDRFILMFAPITRNYGENYADSPAFEGELAPYVRNKLIMPPSLAENMKHLNTWQEWIGRTATKPLDSFIYDYHLIWPHCSDPGYEVAANSLFEDMKYLHHMGLDGNVSCQSQRVYFPSGLVVRGMADALWNENEDFDVMADRYYKESFGEEGPAIRNLYKTISENFTLYKEQYDKRGKIEDGAIFVKDPEAVLAAANALEAIAKGHREEAEGVIPKKEWQLMILHAEYVRQFCRVFVLKQQGQKEAADEAAVAMFNWIDEHEMEFQEVFEVGIYKRRMADSFGLKLNVPRYS